MHRARPGLIDPRAGTAPSIRKLAWLVARDVNITIGGGFAAMELLRRTFGKRGWLDESGHALLIAISRLTPGTNVLAYCAALGWQLRGAPGSSVALLAGSIPSAAIVYALTATLARVDQYRSVRAALALGMIVSVALVLSTAWHLMRPYIMRSGRGLTITVAVASALLLVLDVTPVRILLVCAAIGGLWPRKGAA